MDWFITLLRRSLWLVVLGATAGVAWWWWSDRNALPSPSLPPVWPPLQPSTSASDGTAVDATPSALLVDTPDGGTPAPSGNWVVPNDDGSCPTTHSIKANDNSGIFHVPGGRSYDRTKAERCYATADAAIADGFRQAKA